jgi:hypothetical protein
LVLLRLRGLLIVFSADKVNNYDFCTDVEANADWQISPLLKPITLKLERAAVFAALRRNSGRFADGADGALVKALWPSGADLQRDLDGTSA